MDTKQDRRMPGARATALVIAETGVALMVIALWLPWHQSGDRSRNAFELLATVARLDAVPSPLIDIWQLLVATIPVWGAVTVIAIAIGSMRIFVTATLAVAVVVVAFAGILTWTVELRELGEITALAGAIFVGLGLSSLLRVHRRTEPTKPPWP